MRSRKQIEAQLAKWVPIATDPEKATPLVSQNIELLFDAVTIELLLDMRDLVVIMNRRLSRLGSTSTP